MRNGTGMRDLTSYESLVVQAQSLTAGYSHVYQQGGTPYELSSRKWPYRKALEELADALDACDCVVVGGASGLSAAGGGDFYYPGGSYERHFGKWARKYGFRGAFDGTFYRGWRSERERWGYLATFLNLTQNAPVREPYRDLDALLGGKDFFVLTTNQDTQFVKVYPWEKVAEVQGDHRFFQCARCCHDEVWDAVEPVRAMVEAMGQERMEVPSELVPRCPRCGGEAFPWVRGYGNFLEGSLYQEQYQKVSDYLDAHEGARILYFELGVGRMTPMFIQEPFWHLTAANKRARYVTVNDKAAFVPRFIENRGTAIKGDIAQVLKDALALRDGTCRG